MCPLDWEAVDDSLIRARRFVLPFDIRDSWVS
jgi:hypothetical protein